MNNLVSHIQQKHWFS